MTVPQPPRPGYKQPNYYAPPPPPPAQHSLANYAPVAAAPPPPPATGGIFTPYVAGWSLLGVLALGYIGLVTFAPGVLSDANPQGGFSDPQGQRFASRVSTDIAWMKENIVKLQMDVAKVKTEVDGQAASDKVLAAQFTALERRLSGSNGNVEASTEPPSADDGKALPFDIEAQAAKPAGSPEQPHLVNAQKSGTAETALETGSVTAAVTAGGKAVKAAAKPAAAKPAEQTAKVAEAAAPIDFGTAVVKPAPKPVGVQISSGASVDSLRLSWSLLADRHADALKNMEARYVARGDEAAPTYDLIAGPIKSRSEAQRVCKALAAKNVPCKIGDFLGEAL